MSSSSIDSHKTQHTAHGYIKPPILRSSPLVTITRASIGLRVVQNATAFREIHSTKTNEEPFNHLATELRTPRLNDIHHRLWLAGRPTSARPLHRQRLLGRTILITENPDEHLVWFENQIFVKPLPDFLLDWELWDNYLCLDEELYKAACGLLLSYAWLVRHKSDLNIAKETGLLPHHIEWFNWVEFIDSFLNNVNCETLSGINKRYEYGELRLTRLNTIYRILPPAHSRLNLIKGYQSQSTWCGAFFDRHFKWVLAVFAILTVILSALQVGLATSTLQNNTTFQRTSFRFTITSLVSVVASLAVVFFVWFGLFFYHLSTAWANDKAVNCRRMAARSAPVVC